MSSPKKKDPSLVLSEITWDSIIPPYPDYPYFDGARDYPFRHAETKFDMVNAWWLIESSTLSYAEEEFVSPRFYNAGLTEVKFFTGNSTQCFVANNEDFAIIVFRETELRRRTGATDWSNVIADIEADANIILTDSGQGGNVHKGFKDALDEVWEKEGLFQYISSKDTPNRTIWFTGHSLGAALATLATNRYGKVHGLYTCGSPRVGDAAFKKNFRINTYRFVNNKDIVTRVPPPILYEHVGNLKYISSDGIVYDYPSIWDRMTDSMHGEISRIFNSTGLKNRGLIPEYIVDHVPTLYATHIWNNIL